MRPQLIARRTFASLVLLFAVLAALLSGCDLGRPPHGNRLPDEQQRLHLLDIGVARGDVVTLDPALVQFGSDQDLVQLLFPPLVTFDDHLRVIPSAAKTWDVSAGGTTYTFHLNAGMQWSDGVAIDASAFAYSINRAADPCLGSPVEYYLSLIAGADALNATDCPKGADHATGTLIGSSLVVADPLTLRITLTRAAAYFPAMLAYPPAYAVPRQLIERYGNDWTLHLADGDGFGGNLYKLTFWRRQDPSDPSRTAQLIFARNDRFWGKKPALRFVDLTLYRSWDELWTAYTGSTTGTATGGPREDGVRHVGRNVFDQVRHTPGFAEVPSLDIVYLAPRWTGLTTLTTNTPFADLRVRRAFDLAIDRRTLAETVFQGAVIPTIHMVPQGMPGYNPNLTDPLGRQAEAALSADVGAARLLAQGYANEKCGGDFARCPPVHLIVNTGRHFYKQLAGALLPQWQATFPGWPITWGGPGPCCQVVPHYPFEFRSWSVDYPDPQDFLSLLTRDSEPYNTTKCSMPEADALMDAADVNLDPAARLAQYQRAEQLEVTAVCWMPLYQEKYGYFARPTVHGWHPSALEITTLPTWQSAYMQD